MLNWHKYALFLVSLLTYTWLGYYVDRSHFVEVLGAFALLFLVYGLWLRKTDHWKLREIWLFAIGIRVVLLFSVPNLSDDFYRFVWDGNLVAGGENPYLSLPSDQRFDDAGERIYMQEFVYDKLNSPNYYTVYPPISQLVFGTSSLFAGNNLHVNVLLLKLFLLLAEVFTLWVILKLLTHFKMNKRLVAWYALNPLIVIELVGNIHFEGVMVLFVLLAVYWILRQRYLPAGLGLAVAICIKLWPLIFLPLLIKRLGWGRSLQLFMYTAAFGLLFFLPFASAELFANAGSSMGLYFQSFEFNASLYYLCRWVGYRATGYNLIQYIGPALSLITLLFVGWLWYSDKQRCLKSWLERCQWVLFVYLICSPIVHPWYVTPLVAFAVFSQWRFGVVWSAVVVLSYYAYSTGDYSESMWLIAVEYTVLAGYFVWRRLFYLPVNVRNDKPTVN